MRAEALYGRRRECDVLDVQVAAVRAGRSAVLILRGEAGVGKTALLEYVAQHAADCRIVRAVLTLVRSREHSGHRIPTGVGVMQSGQIERPHDEQATAVSRRGWR